MHLIILTIQEMAVCVKDWPSPGQPNLIFYSGKTCGNNKSYVDLFKPKIEKTRLKKAPFTSLSPRNNKQECSVRFKCKVCTKDFVFKALKEVCVPGKDVKWKLVTPTETTCKCFQESTAMDAISEDENGETTSAETVDVQDKVNLLAELDAAPQMATPSRQTNIIFSQKTPLPSPFINSHQSPRAFTPFSASRKTLFSNQQENTPAKRQPLEVAQSHNIQPTTSSNEKDRREIEDELLSFSSIVQTLPVIRAKEAIQIGKIYAKNIKNFEVRSQQHPTEGSPDTICDKMSATLCRSLVTRVFLYTTKDKSISMSEMLKAMDRPGSEKEESEENVCSSANLGSGEEGSNASVKRHIDHTENVVNKKRKQFHMTLRKSD